MAAILVIDPSPAVRETLRTVLGGEHAVALAPSWDDVASHTAPPDLVIFGAPPPPRDDCASSALARAVAPHARGRGAGAARHIDRRPGAVGRRARNRRGRRGERDP